MPVIIKTSEMQYKDGNGDYHGINAVAEKKVSEQIADLDAAITARETRIDNDIDDLDAEIDALGSRIDSESTRANGIISQMQTAVDDIENQEQTMIARIASVAGQGTDTTLSQSGVAADAKATGDLKAALSNSLNLTEIAIYENGKLFNTASTSVPMSNNTPVSESSANYCTRLVACSPGDKFFIAGTGASTSKGRLYAFAKTDGTFTDKAPTGTSSEGTVVIAPAESAWFMMNARNDLHNFAYSFIDYDDIIDGVETELSDYKKTGAGSSIAFSIASGSTHSALNDQLNINIATGEKFVCYVQKSSDPVCFVQIIAYYEDGTHAPIAGASLSSYMFEIELTASKNIVALGVYSASENVDRTISFVAVKKPINDYILDSIKNNTHNDEFTSGDRDHVEIATHYLKSDGTAAFSDSWTLEKYKCTPGEKLRIKAFMNAVTTYAQPKCAYVFLNKGFGEIGDSSAWDATNVVSTSPIYTECANQMFEYDVVCPANAHTLIVVLGGNASSYGYYNTEVTSSYARRLCVEKFDRTMLIAFADSESDGVYTITESFSVSIDTPFGICMLLGAYAMWNGSSAPSIRTDYRHVYTGMEYNIGENGRYKRTEIRIPPRVDSELTITVTIPAGTALYVKQMDVTPETNRSRFDCGIQLDAHRGFFGFTPPDTIQAFTYAAVCGYPACITIPKVTSDGVLVCCHDDAINATAMNMDGTAISGTVKISESTYTELLAYDFSKGMNAFWRTAKIPTVEEFFEICAKTGMRPIFSTHVLDNNDGLTVEQWQEVKTMLVKYNLLSKFTVKAFNVNILNTAFSVLKSDIFAYVGDNISLATMQANDVNNATCKKGVELQFDNWTAEKATAVINAGYTASAWEVGKRTSDAYKTLYKMGVSEFVDDYNCSFGLDW